jgi:hypothetical protein
MPERRIVSGWLARTPVRFFAGGLIIIAAAAVAVLLVVRYQSNSIEASQNVPLKPAPIDGERAYKYLLEICKIGPRPAGSEANARQRQLVAEHFKKYGATVREHPFKGRDPLSGKPVAMANLIGSWNPERPDRVLIGVHYDTRPFPDEDTDSEKRRTPFIGANDGASGVALLMEMAHHLNELESPWGIDLVLFDGEELVYGGGDRQHGEYFLGSKAFSQAYSAGVTSRRLKYRYRAALVLDMIGDKDLEIGQEPYSVDFAPELVREVWSVARRLNAKAFRFHQSRAVLDDHFALNNAGIPAIDIIDFDYPHWHTADDLPEQCSGASLEQVGKVVTAWLAQPEPRRRRR